MSRGYGADFEGKFHIESLPQGWEKLNEIEGFMALYSHEESDKEYTLYSLDERYAERYGIGVTTPQNRVEELMYRSSDIEECRDALENLMRTHSKLWDNDGFKRRWQDQTGR